MNLAQLVDASRRLVMSGAGSAIRALLEPRPIPLVIPTRTHQLSDSHASGDGRDPLTGEADVPREARRLTVRPRARTAPMVPASPSRAQVRAALREQARAKRLQDREAARARRVEEKRERAAARVRERALAARARLDRGKITPAVRAQRRASGQTMEVEVLGLLKAGAKSASELRRAMNANIGTLYVTLSNLRRKGLIDTTGPLGARMNSLVRAGGR